MFQLAKFIRGNKKESMEAQAVQDPESGKLVVTTKEIQAVVLSHCKNILSNNKPEKEIEKEIEVKEALHDLRMEEKREDLVSLEVYLLSLEGRVWDTHWRSLGKRGKNL